MHDLHGDQCSPCSYATMQIVIALSLRQVSSKIQGLGGKMIFAGYLNKSWIWKARAAFDDNYRTTSTQNAHKMLKGGEVFDGIHIFSFCFAKLKTGNIQEHSLRSGFVILRSWSKKNKIMNQNQVRSESSCIVNVDFGKHTYVRYLEFFV